MVLDSYVQRRAVEVVNVMKLDVEGSEKAALQGAAALIERDHPDVVIECNAFTCGNHGYSYRELLRFLAARGYRLYRLHKNRLCPWAADFLQEVVVTDYFATTKTAEEITARCGWPISALTREEMVGSILEQDPHGPIHQQFVLAIQSGLPAEVKADARVAPLLHSRRLPGTFALRQHADSSTRPEFGASYCS